jgi:hypothetical protein
MIGTLAWIWRGTIGRAYMATRALSAGRRQGPAHPQDLPPGKRVARDAAVDQHAPRQDQQHVNPTNRLERGHPKR